MNKLTKIIHETEVCVIGGGLAGMCAAISAARHGTKVVLMHDRPMLGGNASSEIRMWICGAGSRVKYLQETGLMEEITLENMKRNPDRIYPLWDALLYEKVRFQDNIELLLNCACCDAVQEKQEIKSVTGFQLTTYTWHEVKAKIFIDCSGDSILAGLTDARYMIGREAKSEYHEEFGLPEADRKTMGMSLLIQARETDHPVKFNAPSWAYCFNTDEEMHNKPHTCLQDLNTNFYWIELGGEMDTIGDSETIRDELLKIAFGVWDHMKNRGEHGAENWEIEWMGFLPGKRESRRYLGDYVLTQNDVENAAKFEDEVAYGGWQIDNHLPGGFFMTGKDGGHLQKRRLSKPYGIPFRSLYSVNIVNLMFAGRNISASHIAFASTRVMGTCGILGQAVGTAASIAVGKGVTPRTVKERYIGELQKLLNEDDCYLPHVKREIDPLAKVSELTSDYGDPFLLRDGIDRRVEGMDHGFYGRINSAITYMFPNSSSLKGVRIIFDSDLDREYCEGNPNVMNIPMPLFKARSYRYTSFGFPSCMVKEFKVEYLKNGEWNLLYETDCNIQRFVRIPCNLTCEGIRLIPIHTYASAALIHPYLEDVHIFGFEPISE